ncbi:hypothetical protein B0H19DRAFT_1261467 [Mycena capillaripes]|nr:hypothetical protein B0H19DRAFT_1261467 [Mycena capillaripes]
MATTSGGNLIDPAQRLPTELLTEIFYWCDHANTHGPPGGFFIDQAPWLLTHVCRHWRAVLLATPRLWRTITVNMAVKTKQAKIEGIFMMTRLFLERSAQCPIAVLIAGDNLPPNWPVLELLMSACERWEDLRLYADGVIICGLTTIRGRLHQLVRLDVFRADDETPPTVLDIFLHAPSLREVQLTHDSFLSLSLPWSQLTDFSTSYTDLAPMLYTLRNLVNLEVLTLDRLEGSEIVYQLPIAQLPHLHELTITADHGQEGHPGGLLDYLSLPALERLSLDCEDISICPHLTALITRSSCHLDMLSLSLYDTLDTPLTAVLSLTPRLTELELRGRATTDAFLAQLTRSPTELAPSLVPLLESLTLRAPFNQTLLFRLVESRFEPEFDSDSDSSAPRLVCELSYIGVEMTPEAIEPVLVHGLSSLHGMGLGVEMLR